jgi:hypothetical protein
MLSVNSDIFVPTIVKSRHPKFKFKFKFKFKLKTPIGTDKLLRLQKGLNKINWKQAEIKIKDLQEKIVIATLKKDFK